MDDYVFRRKGMKLPMTPSTFTWRFKKILRANTLPDDLNVHSLRQPDHAEQLGDLNLTVKKLCPVAL